MVVPGRSQTRLTPSHGSIVISIFRTAGTVVLLLISFGCIAESLRMLRAKNFERSHRAARKYFSLLIVSSVTLSLSAIVAPQKGLNVFALLYSVIVIAIIVVLYVVNKKLEPKAAEAERIRKEEQ